MPQLSSRITRITEKFSRKKGGKEPAAELELVEGSSTVNDPVRSLATPSNVTPCSSAQAADSETPPVPTSISQPVPDFCPPIQEQSEPHNRHASNESKPPKPYATNFDLWNEASSHLDGSEKYRDIKKLIGEPDRNSGDVQGLAAVIKDKIETAFYTQECDSRTHRVIKNAVAVLGKFTSAVDVAVSFDPVHAALPWAAVRFVLVALTSVSELRSQVLAGIATVASLLAQCDTYQQLYMAPDLALRPPEAALVKLKTSIVETYTKSQSFLGFAIQQQQSKVRSVAAPFKLGDAGSHVHELSKHGEQLAQAADNCEKYCHLLNRSNVEGFLKLNATFHQIIQNQIELFLDRIDRNDLMEMLDWISSIQYGKHHNRVKNNRTSDTCEWLLRHEKFHKWEDSSSSMILWLQGSPGAGKTFLTSKVIDHVKAQVENSPNQEGFAFFYCNRNEEERQKSLCVLQSYVRQLSTTVKNPGCIRKQLQDLYRETRLKGSDFGFSDCQKQLLESTNLYSQTTLVLDALDECEPDSRRQILETVEYLLSESRNPLKVFISSRPERDIRNRFLHRPNVEIKATDNEEDIQKFASEEITKHENWGGMSPGLRDTIIKVLFTQSQGMFQWAFLQIKEILRLETESAIRDRLGKLPADLDTAYDEIYTKIKNRNKHDRAFADNAFKLVACAYKPLSSTELLSAIRLGSEKDTFDLSGTITVSQLLHLCNNLLVLDSQRNVWRFSHLSVTEYFEKKHWSLPRAHCHAAIVCLKLIIETYKTPSRKKWLKGKDGDSWDHYFRDKNNQRSQPDGIFELMHPLQKYAQLNWIPHTEAQEGQKADPTLMCLLKCFLGEPLESSLEYRLWYRVTVAKSSGYINRMVPEAVALFAMCRFSFYNLLQEWWEDATFDITLTASNKCSLLGLAAKGGCRRSCENLIKRGADVNLHIPGVHGSALVIAVYYAHFEVVKLLVEAEADVNLQLQHGVYGSALAAAAYYGNAELVELFINKGADVNMQLHQGQYGSALAAAAQYRNIKAIECLIQAGADVDMQLPVADNGNALLVAIASGRIEAVAYLVLNVGADVNQQVRYGNYGSALVSAAFWGRKECANILIQAGAKANLRVENGLFRSALKAAKGTFPDRDTWLFSWEAQKIIEKDRDTIAELLQLHGATDEV
ncbi:hypothetical protein F4782DRAFT_155191 [Xylaria castorea]|nr:hypothetical protein F4782DRAFT_155191 [Xylaria castorea]